MEEARLSPLCAKTVEELLALLAAGTVTSRQVTQAFLDSAAAQNSSLNAFLTLEPQEALAQADASDRRRQAGQLLSPLDGIPIGVKDNILRQGKACTCASRMLEGFVAPYDATVVTKVKEAGLPLLGSLNLDEFAMGSTGETSAFGPARNPWDTSRSPGGSSGGGGAAVAAGMTPLALCTDTGGSVRQPAAFCGVVGIKPAYGTISRYGLVAYASSLDQVGIIAKTAVDGALALNLLAGADPRDMTSDGCLAVDFAVGARQYRDARGITLGVPQEGLRGLSQEMAQAMEAALRGFRSLGAQVVEVSLPALAHALPAYQRISSAEASSNLARYDGVRYGFSPPAQAQSLGERYRQARQQGFGPEVRQRVLLGTLVLDGDWGGAYQQAEAVRRGLACQVEEALAQCHALVMPVADGPAFPLGEGARGEAYPGDGYTVPANLCGLPALSVPCGLSSQGLPLGLGLMGGRHSLPQLLGLGSLYQRAYPLAERPPYGYQGEGEEA